LFFQELFSKISIELFVHFAIKTGSVGPTRSSGSSSTPPVKRYFVTDKVTVTMTTEVFMEHLVNAVVKDGAPIRFFSSASSKGLLGEMAKKLGISLKRDRVTHYVISAADKHKKELLQQLKNKWIHIKMDCATRVRTNYLAVNVRFIDDNSNVVTKTLAIVDTKAQHTSKELKALLMKVLEDFEIPLKNIVCVVTDNASNMLKLVKTLSADAETQAEAEAQEAENEPHEAISSSDESSSSSELEDGDESSHTGETEGRARRAARLNEELSDFDATLRQVLEDYIVQIRCGMHTFQGFFSMYSVLTLQLKDS